MEDGVVTKFNLVSIVMHPVPTCCMRITNMFKHGQYSNRSNVTGEIVVMSDEL